MKKPCKSCRMAIEQLQTQGKTYFSCEKIENKSCEKMQKYQAYLESKRKYKKGEVITSLDELLKQEFVWVYGKPKHNGFIHSMPFRLLTNMVKQGNICKAELKLRCKNDTNY